MKSARLLYEYRDFLKERYGEVLQRVPLDPGFGCPHRKRSGGGCSFCPEDGARAVQLGTLSDIREQIRAGVAFAKKRYQAQAFMAYLQAFTNTFTSVQRLEELVALILEQENFRAISIGTRPDCLPEATLAYLSRLQRSLDVWVELGVQTSHDATLERINRGHDWAASRRAIRQLHRAGVSVAVHLIIGLPGETRTHFRQTMEALAELPVDAIKLHNLHIIAGTALAREHKRQPLPLLGEYGYGEILLELLPYIPADRAIIRLSTDTPKEQLIGPCWTMNKGQFRNYLIKQMQQRQISQGMALTSPPEQPAADMKQPSPPQPVETEDGSFTFWNPKLKEHYHTLAGARSEAREKYCRPGALKERLKRGRVRVLDICFGLGYNSLTACSQALAENRSLEITALEMDRGVVAAAAATLREDNSRLDWNDCLARLCSQGSWSQDGCSIRLLWGDARHTIGQAEGPFELIWLDAFSTQRNSELWTVDFFRALRPLLAPDGALLTYCAAIPVRAGLREAGFMVGETQAFGRSRGGTIAACSPLATALPLPERDLFLMTTVRGTPYRDPNATRTNREILRAREEEILQRKQREGAQGAAV
ncbi:TIGR01212 family radical SAM protein [Desulfogranum mediterraneum]|uniref:TIGR01212 family radical SAM protein n=1 Tax=Desulfogranum mediterraneum TaxID=160661 RepID=UPI00041EB6CF|nr:TIGR01212 family radical SAM protein [Desulfogranum mediterraneum]